MRYVLGDALYTSLDTRVVAGSLPDSGAQVAVKLSREEPPSARFLDRLRHEYAMLREAAVPGVVRVIDLVPRGQGLALVLERWGESLDRVLARGALPLGTALRLGAAVARALGEVHRRGIVHRDIKPHNVLVEVEQRSVRLIDFGLATRRPTRVEEAEPAQAVAGTLAYVAPEQTGRMRRIVDARADLYALGATLYQMLTGALPFESNDPIELIHAHIARTPVAPHERAPERRIPETVSAIVLKLLEKSPDQRYQTADGVAFDLERAAHAVHALAAAAAERDRCLPGITLAPLGDEALDALVGELLDRPAEEVRALSSLVKGKTDGGPFFVEQFLHALYERALLKRDPECKAAGCDDFLPKPIHAEQVIEELQHHLGLEWIRRAESSSSTAASRDGESSPPRPSDEALATLRELVDKGRIKNVLEEADRLAADDPRLAPWLDELRRLARQLRLAALRDFVRHGTAG